MPGIVGIGQDAAGQELHDVEDRADHRIVLAERVGLGHRHVGVIGQRLDHAILAIDLVRRGQQLARRLLAQHVHAAAAVSHVKGRIALPALELQHAERPAIAVDVGLHVVGQPRLVEDVGGADGREVLGQFGHWHGVVVSFTGRAVLAVDARPISRDACEIRRRSD